MPNSPHQPEVQQGYKTHSDHLFSILHAFQCKPLPSACESSGEGMNNPYNEKSAICLSAISRRLRQCYVCILEVRKHTNCMPSKIILQTSINYLNQFDMLKNALDLYSFSHNKHKHYVKKIYTSIIKQYNHIMMKRYGMLIKGIIHAYGSVRLCQKVTKHSFSDIKLQHGPQLNLWNGLKFEKKWSKNMDILLCKHTYSHP